MARDIEQTVVDSLLDVLVGDLAFLSLAFEYQHAVKDWFAVGAAFSAAARIGTEARSALAQGITSMFGYEFRALARIMEEENFLLSSTVRIQPEVLFLRLVHGRALRVLGKG